MKPFLLGLFICLSMTSAMSAAEDCKSKSDNAERLKCYDAAAAPTKPEQQKPAESPLEVKIVDAAELSIGAGKYHNQTIGLRRVRCYYADVQDFRCMTGENVAIFTKTIAPETAEKFVQDNCDTLKKVTNGERCRINIYFKFGPDDVVQDIVSGYERRRVIRPPDGINVLFQADVVGRKSR